MQFLVFGDLLFQPHVFWQYSIISKSVKYVTLLHIVTYIKESIITKLQKLYSPPRNLRVGNKSPVLFLKKQFRTGDLSPVCKIFIERPGVITLKQVQVASGAQLSEVFFVKDVKIPGVFKQELGIQTAESDLSKAAPPALL